MVAVFADHPPKIKLDPCILVREITVYKLSIKHACTLIVLNFILFIESFTPTWYSLVVRHSFWGWYDLWQPLKDWFDVGTGHSSGCLLAYSMNLVGLSWDGRLEVCARQGSLIPQPPYLMHLGRCEYPLSVFKKTPIYGKRRVLSVQPKMPSVRIAQTDRPSLPLIWWSLGTSRSSLITLPFSLMKPWCLWPFLVDLPMPQRDSMLVLEKPTSTLNTKRVAYAPIPVIFALVSIDSSVDQIPTKYPLSSVFWMGLVPIKYSLFSIFWMCLYKENNSSHRAYGFVPVIRCVYFSHCHLLYNLHGLICWVLVCSKLEKDKNLLL